MTDRAHTKGSFTRGSQIILHTLRMMSQGTKATFWGGGLCALAWVIFQISQRIQLPDLYYWGMAQWAEVKLDWAGTFVSQGTSLVHVYDFKLGVWRTLESGVFVSKIWSGEVGHRLLLGWHYMTHQALLEGLGAFLIGAVVTALFFSWSGWKKAQGRHIRGQNLVSVKKLKKIMKKKNLLGEISLEDIPLVKDRETSHMLIAGTTGSGKTNALHHLLPQLREQKAVIVDLTGELTKRYFDKGQGDVLLSPSAPQSVQWNPWLDSRTLFEYRAFAEAFVGEVTKQDPFWSQAASECLAAALEKLSSRQSIGELTQILTKSSLEEFCRFFQNTTAAAYADPKVLLIRGPPRSTHRRPTTRST